MSGTGGVQPHVVESFLEFFEVVLHTLLHARGVYPPPLFERRTKYGCVVYQSSSPLLCDSIRALFDELRPLLTSNSVETLVVPLLHASTGALLERYTLEVDFATPTSEPVTERDIEDQLGAAVRHLQALEVHPPLPHGTTTWTVQIHAHCPAVGVEGEAPPPLPFWARVGEGEPTHTALGPTAAPRRVLKTIRAHTMGLSLGVDIRQ